MGSEWPLVTLKDAANWYSGGTPPKSKAECWGGDIPWISAKSMGGTRYGDSELKLTAEGLKSSRLAPTAATLLLVRGSMLHQRIPVGIATRPVAFNQDVKAIVPKTVFHPLFFYYSLAAREDELLSKVENTGIGAGKLDTGVLHKIEIPCPPIKEQKRIVNFLGSLDEKIELNRQTNQTLESMAQALFKSWFVDFDPVIDNALAAGNEIPEPLAAKAAARRALQEQGTDEANQPHTLPDHIRQLFPSRFQFTEELGWIPEGWKIKPLDQIAHYQNGLALQKFRPRSESDEYLPVLKIAHLKLGATDGKEKAATTIKPECIVDDGDVIFSWSGSLVVDLWSGGKAALNQHLFKVTSGHYPKWFYYHFTQHHLEEFIRIAADKAVTMGHIKREHLSRALCAVSEPEILEHGTSIIGRLIDKQLQVRSSNRVLTRLRDTLLPKLLSGELRIPEAKKELDEALA